MPLLEAMASGVPVVASNTTSLPEVAGKAGLVVDPNSPESIRHSIETVLQASGVAARMVANGLRRASEFTWERSTDRLAAAYGKHFGLEQSGCRDGGDVAGFGGTGDCHSDGEPDPAA